nr:hypothetical protein [Sphingorhabdus sp.]
PFDNYYDCDYRGGFYNIGYGGGWYQDYWYPGYGFYIFDRGGRRYNMHDNHRRYWAGRRHEWYREHHRNRDGHDGRRGHENRRNYNGGANGNIGWPEQHGGRVEDRRPREGYRDPNAVSNGQPDVGQRDRRREGRRSEGRGERRRDWQQNGQGAVQQVPPVATPQAQPPARGDRGSWRRGGEGERRNWQAPAAPQSSQGTATPAPAPAQQPRMARPGGDQPRAPRNHDRGPREN